MKKWSEIFIVCLLCFSLVGCSTIKESQKIMNDTAIDDAIKNMFSLEEILDQKYVCCNESSVEVSSEVNTLEGAFYKRSDSAVGAYYICHIKETDEYLMFRVALHSGADFINLTEEQIASLNYDDYDWVDIN